MEYMELDTTSRLNLVRGRIRDIEREYFGLNLRVQAPDLSVPISEQDRMNLSTLENSLATLRQMEQELSAPPPAPTPAPSGPGK